MDIFKHFGIDVGKDTLDEIITKMTDKGLGNFSVVPRDKDDKPRGMFLVLSDPDAIPYVERALEEYDADMEREEEGEGEE